MPAGTTSRRLGPMVAAGWLAWLAAGCATAPSQGDDPLKNTKKLAAEGHLSLYNNGAFQVPNTSIRLIPSAPSAMELARELMGIRARQALLLSLQRAKESVTIVAEGTKLSLRTGTDIHDATDRVKDELQRVAREGSTIVIYRGSEKGLEIVGKSWTFSKETAEALDRIGARIAEETPKGADRLAELGSVAGARTIQQSWETAKALVQGGKGCAAETLSSGWKHFIEGYAAVPSKMKAHGQAIGARVDRLNFGERLQESNELRSRWSKQMTDLAGDTVGNYSADVGQSFINAGQELSDYHTTGISLASLRSMRWVLQGLLWDAVVEPGAKLSAASVGYIGVNGLAFPALVAAHGGTASTQVAVEVGWNASKSGYDLIAPSGTVAVAGVYSLLDLTGSSLSAATIAGAGTLIGYGTQGASQVASVTLKGTGFAAGKGVQYIGVPLAAAGVAVGGGTVGVAAGTTAVGAGTTLRVVGETGAAASYAFGNLIAGTTIVGGTAASAGVAAAYSFYEVNRAIIVPAGFEFGGGIVLSYGTLSHLGAHTVLAASDLAYLVLSLEGPRWVVYGIKGTLGKGEDLPAGTVLNLKKMQEAGEEIYNIPVSDEEMKAVVNSVYDDLPEVEE